MKLIKISATATCCVILRSDFANVGKWFFFENADQANAFAEENGGRVVNEDGLKDKFESMHCAEGRVPNQSADGRFVEDPDDADDDWMEQHWDEEYTESAREAFENATVYEVEEETEKEEV